ncbi:uncharacterized protein N7482_001448 [Penicillium canariense]|uniref:Integral membrane protein TmpA n=1 Tax=Penicillium canariense TaxID=189055 RepID=A0A9W9IJR4_9EURO|nr:uncharacterized protein N7482_001448 [Penicillium canariense]KAJ5175571.1 hypothetical protein N7482_001448 [Penicillium canariense]
MADPEKSDACVLASPAEAVCPPSGPNDAVASDNEKVVKKRVPKKPTHRRNISITLEDLEAQTNSDLPRKRFAYLRYAVFTMYRRLFTVVFLINLACFIYVMVSHRQILPLVNATAVNLVACGLARHPVVVNCIYRVVCSLPRSAPLFMRRMAAKAAHYGGVHSGCGTASLVWYAGFVGVASKMYWTSTPISSITDHTFSTAPIAVAYVILVLLLVMIVVAYPVFRRKMHDYFELTHRFTSWLILALFIVLVMLFANDIGRAEEKSLGYALVTLPAFWLLIAAVVAIAHPWLLLRRIPVQTDALSPHAIRLHFSHTPISFAKGIQVSKHPLRDWHSFAGFPDPSESLENIKRIPTEPSGPTRPPGAYKKGHRRNQESWSIVVSKAGDWTADTISKPPTHVWKRGALMRGVGYGLRLFHRIIIVTTGSGIGPCLGFLGDERRPLIKVVWQTRNPVKTYGQGVIDLVHQMGPDPIILDTSRDGRIDMLPIVRQQVEEFEAEAVFVISNPPITRKIVYEFESHGIPAYGPIFDS